MNANQLAVFLAANLLTGAVNLAVQTLRATEAQGLAVLIAYLTALHGLAVAAYELGWRLRL